MKHYVSTMRSLSLFLLLLLCTSSSWAQGLLGSWEGTLRGTGFALPLELHIKAKGTEHIVTIDSPAQGVFGVEMTQLHLSADSISFVHIPWDFHYQARLTAGEIVGEVRQLGMRYPLTLRPKVAIAKTSGIDEQELTIPSGEVQIAATLARKQGAKAVRPLLILVSGSGPVDRDGTMPGMKYKFYQALSDSLVLAGYDVLRYDKRGTGKTGGDANAASLDILAQDLKAVVAFMNRLYPERSLALLGHSEGGIISSMALNLGARASALYLIGTPSLSINEIARKQRHLLSNENLDAMLEMLRANMEAEGVESKLTPEGYELAKKTMNKQLSYYGEAWDIIVDERLDKAAIRAKLEKHFATPPAVPLGDKLSPEELPKLKKTFDMLSKQHEETAQAILKQLDSPYSFSFIRTQPLKHISKLRLPIYALFMELDTQVDMDNVEPLRRALPKADIRMVPKTNHLMQSCTDGSMQLYWGNPEGISRDFLASLLSQLQRHFQTK